MFVEMIDAGLNFLSAILFCFLLAPVRLELCFSVLLRFFLLAPFRLLALLFFGKKFLLYE